MACQVRIPGNETSRRLMTRANFCKIKLYERKKKLTCRAEFVTCCHRITTNPEGTFVWRTSSVSLFSPFISKTLDVRALLTC